MEPRRPRSLWRVYQMLAATLRQAVGAALTFAQWAAGSAALNRDFQDEPRKRPSQAAAAMRFAAQRAAPSQLC